MVKYLTDLRSVKISPRSVDVGFSSRCISPINSRINFSIKLKQSFAKTRRLDKEMKHFFFGLSDCQVTSDHR